MIPCIWQRIKCEKRSVKALEWEKRKPSVCPDGGFWHREAGSRLIRTRASFGICYESRCGGPWLFWSWKQAPKLGKLAVITDQDWLIWAGCCWRLWVRLLFLYMASRLSVGVRGLSSGRKHVQLLKFHHLLTCLTLLATTVPTLF